mmetsp:Transcript_110789/g.213393  ORF Transcript_110789/g.213393 Transcript_110789/m.213393 type:complete len:239 (+) Transcript_110789:228-944(+)
MAMQMAPRHGLNISIRPCHGNISMVNTINPQQSCHQAKAPRPITRNSTREPACSSPQSMNNIARCSAVKLERVVGFPAAGCTSTSLLSSWARSVRTSPPAPFFCANCNAVLPWALTWVLSAFAFTSSLTTSMCLPLAAMCKAENPILSCWPIAAPVLSTFSVKAASPERAASCRTVRCSPTIWFPKFTSARASRSKSKISSFKRLMLSAFSNVPSPAPSPSMRTGNLSGLVRSADGLA